MPSQTTRGSQEYLKVMSERPIGKSVDRETNCQRITNQQTEEPLVSDKTINKHLFKAFCKIVGEVQRGLGHLAELVRAEDESIKMGKPLSRNLRRHVAQAQKDINRVYAKSMVALDDKRDRINRARLPDLKFDWNDVADSVNPKERFHVSEVPKPPTTVREMMESKFQKYFMRAMLAEMESLRNYDVYDVTTLPKGRRAVSSKWVFDYKTDPQGFIERFKARLVAVGSSQVPGRDYNETHSPVVKIKVIRTLLAISCLLGLKVEQIDVNTAFLNGTLSETNFMKLPKGFEQVGLDGKPLVAKLKKSLYGLHQAGREWYKTLKAFLIEIGFEDLMSDACTFLKLDETTGQLIIVVVYVDDLLLACKDPKVLADIKTQIQSKFGIKDLGEAEWILKIQIQRFASSMWLGQTAYIEKILREHECWDIAVSKMKATPMEVSWTHDEMDTPLNDLDNQRYTRIIAELLYLAQMTRPDIMYAVNVLAQFQRGNARTCDMNAAMRVLRYLRKTWDLGLYYSPDSGSDILVFSSENAESINGKPRRIRLPDGYEPEMFTDASYAQETDRKSRSAYVFMVFGCPVIWYSKKQTVTALSSTEAELYALVEGIKEATWMREFLSEVGFDLDKPFTLQQDNQSVIAIAANPIHHARIKHMEVKTYYVRENVDNERLKLVYCPTELMIADILTKALAKCDHERLVGLMNMRSLSGLQSGKTGHSSFSIKYNQY